MAEGRVPFKGLGKRRKKGKAYYRNGKKMRTISELSCGMQGVLITTGDQEKLCIPEAYNLLNQCGDKLYGPEFSSPLSEEDSSDEDVASVLAREVADLKGKQQKERRFQSVVSGARHVVFIACSPSVEPCELVHSLLSDALANGQRVSRYCQRMLPIVKVCRANISDISKHATLLLEPHFHSDPDKMIKFAINYKARNNNVLKRDTVIKTVASLVTDDGDYAHIVDLNNPELTVVVEVIKNLCCLSVVKDFHKLCKYNISTLTEPAVAEVTTPTKESESETIPTVQSEATPTKDSEATPTKDSEATPVNQIEATPIEQQSSSGEPSTTKSAPDSTKSTTQIPDDKHSPETVVQ